MDQTTATPSPKASAPGRKKRTILVLLGIIAAMSIVGAGVYYLANKNGDQQNNRQQDVADTEAESPQEPQESKTVSLYPDGNPSTYEEHLSAIEEIKNTDNEASKIFVYYNAAVFAALSDKPEAKDHASEALRLIEQQDEANRTSFEGIIPTLTAVVDGRHGDIRPR